MTIKQSSVNVRVYATRRPGETRHRETTFASVVAPDPAAWCRVRASGSPRISQDHHPPVRRTLRRRTAPSPRRHRVRESGGRGRHAVHGSQQSIADREGHHAGRGPRRRCDFPITWPFSVKPSRHPGGSAKRLDGKGIVEVRIRGARAGCCLRLLVPCITRRALPVCQIPNSICLCPRRSSSLLRQRVAPVSFVVANWPSRWAVDNRLDGDSGSGASRRRATVGMDTVA